MNKIYKMIDFVKDLDQYDYIGLAILLAAFILLLNYFTVKSKIKRLSRKVSSMTPEKFLELKKVTSGGKGSPSVMFNNDFSGVYVIKNKTRGMYYVGQALRVCSRVNMHFTGKGNGDLYADYKYGHDFKIKMIPLKHSGFKSLNELERHFIAYYKADVKGYNRTKGNKG